jgi:hypothetical protein
LEYAYQHHLPEQDPLHIGIYPGGFANCSLDFVFFQSGAVDMTNDEGKEGFRFQVSVKGDVRY